MKMHSIRLYRQVALTGIHNGQTVTTELPFERVVPGMVLYN
ncbi:MAG: hypothetical protein V7776_11255 [Halopseudomonas aestusnigri]